MVTATVPNWRPALVGDAIPARVYSGTVLETRMNQIDVNPVCRGLRHGATSANDTGKWAGFRGKAMFYLSRYCAVLGLLALTVAPVSADGAFLSAPRFHVSEPNQKALLWLDGGRETLILSVDYQGAVDEFGWVVPVPNRPKITLGPRDLFQRLAEITKPTTVDQRVEVPDSGEMAGAAPPSVEEIEKVQVGPYDATVLAAAQSSALAAWLRQHGYVMPSGATDVLQGYVSEHWYYVAVRVKPPGPAPRQNGREVPTGSLSPLRLEFDSPRLVYPLRMTSLGREDTDVQLYVLGEHRVTVPGFRTQFAGRLSGQAFAGMSSPEVLPPPGGYLTELRGWLTAKDMTSDVIFTRLDADAPYRRAKTNIVYVRVPDPLLTIRRVWPLGLSCLLLAGVVLLRLWHAHVARKALRDS
jgi:hypothetical protein